MRLLWPWSSRRSRDGDDGVQLHAGLKFWQDWRQARVDKVNGLTAAMNNKRLPEAERAKVENPTGGDGQLTWLYRCDIESEMNAGLKKLLVEA